MFVCVCICICVCVYCNESDGFSVAEELCVCVERERERESSRFQKIRKLYSKESKNKQQLQREREGAYLVTFSQSSLTSTTSWESGRVLTT